MAKPHFNKGVVRGRITEFRVRKTKGNKKPYGELKVFCSSIAYGELTIRLRFWGKHLEDLKTAHKGPVENFYFTGHVGIFNLRGEDLVVFNAYTFKPWMQTHDDQPRASFIIEGRNHADFGGFELRHIREDANYPVDDIFKFPELDEAWGVGPGDLIQVYGHFRDKHAKFGGSGEIELGIEELTIKEGAK